MECFVTSFTDDESKCEGFRQVLALVRGIGMGIGSMPKDSASIHRLQRTIHGMPGMKYRDKDGNQILYFPKEDEASSE